MEVTGSDVQPAFNTAALTTIVKRFMPHANNGNWQSGSLAKNGQKMKDLTFFYRQPFSQLIKNRSES